jgi:TatD DNase family protein
VIDSHCHLADQAFAGDLEEVVTRARQAGVGGGLCILACGEPAEEASAGRLRELWPALRVAVGIHPDEAARAVAAGGDVARPVRQAMLRLGDARAIGEIGLDYHDPASPRDAQRRVFRAQVALAREAGLPVVVHTREADHDTVAILAEEGGGLVRGVFHCFTGTAELARQALDLGFLLSFSGILTFPSAAALRAVAAAVPADRLLVETDCPYLAPAPYRGRRNEPAWVMRTAARLAEIRGVGLDDITAAMEANFDRLFGG